METQVFDQGDLSGLQNVQRSKAVSRWVNHFINQYEASDREAAKPYPLPFTDIQLSAASSLKVKQHPSLPAAYTNHTVPRYEK